MICGVSFAVTMGFLASRAPFMGRWSRLGFYALLIKGVHLVRNISDKQFTESVYEKVTLRVIPQDELRKM